MVVTLLAKSRRALREMAMHDNTLVYGGFKYTRRIILRSADNSRAWVQGSAAPTALAESLRFVTQPFRAGLDCAAPEALVPCGSAAGDDATHFDVRRLCRPALNKQLKIARAS